MPNFYDAFEKAWDDFGLGPTTVPLYRGDKGDPDDIGAPPPYAVYQILVDNSDHFSTGGDYRQRLVNIDCWHKTPGQSLDMVNTIRDVMLKRHPVSLGWFHEYVLPTSESVMDMRIWQFSQTQDDAKKTSSGLWAASLKLKFSIGWVRG